MPRIYLDTAPIIYTVERVAVYTTAVDARLSAEDLTLVTSDLTRMECRVKPLRDGNRALLQDFEDFFAQAIAEIIRLSSEVIDRATEIRAQYNFKTPDAIHLAAAVVSGCEMFLTNDQRLNSFSEIAIEIIQLQTDR